MKQDNGLFDIAMGAFDRADVCELVGNFLPQKLSEKYKRKNLALYRDDGLAIFKNVNGPDPEKIKKHFCKLFIDQGLELTNSMQQESSEYPRCHFEFRKLSILSLSKRQQ